MINGRKWFSFNASHPPCRLAIVVGVSDANAAKAKRQSLILVPTDTQGFKIERNLTVFSHSNGVDQHPELSLTSLNLEWTWTRLDYWLSKPSIYSTRWETKSRENKFL